MNAEQLSEKLVRVLTEIQGAIGANRQLRDWQVVGKRNDKNIIGISLDGPAGETMPPALMTAIDQAFEREKLDMPAYFSRYPREVETARRG